MRGGWFTWTPLSVAAGFSVGQLNIINCLLAYREILSAKRVKKFVRDRGADRKYSCFFNCIFGHLIASAAPWGFCRPGQSVYFNYLPHHRGDIYIFDFSGAPPWRFCRLGQLVNYWFSLGDSYIIFRHAVGKSENRQWGCLRWPPPLIIYIIVTKTISY